jgi:nitric oxide dioxygenase
MDASTIELLALSFARLSANRNEAASIFYARLFTTAPQLRALFSRNLDVQKQRFITSLAEIVEECQNGLKDEQTFTRFGRQHPERAVQQSHFDAIGDALIFTLAQILGEDFTPEIRTAWICAYTEVSSSLLQHIEGLSVPPPASVATRW